MKIQLRDSIMDDIRKIISRRRERNTKENKQEIIGSDDEYKKMDHSQLIENFNKLVIFFLDLLYIYF